MALRHRLWGHHRLRGHLRLTVSLALGAGAALVAALGGVAPVPAVMTGWVVGTVVLLIWSGRTLLPLDATATRRRAAGEDPGRIGVDAAMLGACAVSLIGVGMLLFDSQAGAAGAAAGPGSVSASSAAVAMLGLASVLSAWTLMHFVFAVRYAAMFYAAVEKDGRRIIDFHTAEDPPFVEFVYLSGTIGVSYAVSDTDVSSSSLRGVLILHAVLSFFLSTVVLASTVNLVLQLAGRL